MYAKALTQEGERVFPFLYKFDGFYLAGGTALALQIGHRLSVDFDLFSGNTLPDNLLQQVRRIFSNTPTSVTYSSPDQLNLLVGGIKVTFLHYPYPIVDQPVEYQGLQLASIREIAVMKAFAIGRRLAYKDYVDWYFMLKEKHVALEDILADAEKKFGGDFNGRLFLGQLVSLDDVPVQKIDFLRDPVDQTAIRQFLTSEVSNFKI